MKALVNSVASCRYCGGGLGETILNLGLHPISNAFLLPHQIASEQRFPLIVRRCPSCHLVQAAHDLPPEALFTSDYVYFSSVSASWVAHAKRFAGSITSRLSLDSQSLVIEIACNDGYLLKHFKSRGIPVLGIEPTCSTASEAERLGIPVERVYFSQPVAKRMVQENSCADLIVANNVLAHVPNIRDFIRGVYLVLKPNGVVSFEFPHLGSLYANVQFDTIYHEHYSYLSLVAVHEILKNEGLKVFDVERLPTHGGSLRVLACRHTASHPVTSSVTGILHEELQAGLDSSEGAAGFHHKVSQIIAVFRAFVSDAKTKGKRIAGYGAAAKGNTFLNACSLTEADIFAVADMAPSKQGRLLPGSHIPVVSPREMIMEKPDYIVILPWNLENEIRAQLQADYEIEAKFVIAIPELRII